MAPKIDTALGKRIIDLRNRIVPAFNRGHWEELGLVAGVSDLIDGQHRLLRSLDFGDEDYDGNVLAVLRNMVERNPSLMRVVEDYLDEHFPGDAHYVSAKPSIKRITFAPHVFQVPEVTTESDLVAVMMPFAAEFSRTYESIKLAATETGFHCLRADDIWEETTIVQDIFNLIFRAHIVVVDFSGRNANVMYETGVAHTLGKHVIPISQALDDIPFDMRHHRVLKYLPNSEGLKDLSANLSRKLKQFSPTAAPNPTPSEATSPFDDEDFPF
jgi:hypothetical protein